jgi:hypothetical protein
MKSEIMNEFLSMIEREAQSRPSAMEFEMAYQARVAIDSIRFAIKQIEQAGLQSEVREVGIQLIDALDRLKAVDRHFQRRSRISAERKIGNCNEARR